MRVQRAGCEGVRGEEWTERRILRGAGDKPNKGEGARAQRRGTGVEGEEALHRGRVSAGGEKGSR